MTPDTLFFPTSIYYTVDGNNLVVWIHGIDEHGTSRRIPLLDTEPAFWVDEIPQDVSHHIHTIIEDDAEDFRGRPLHKVIVDFPFNIPKARQGFINPYEADIPYDRFIRYQMGIRNCILIDTEAKALRPGDIIPADPLTIVEPRIWTLDIETYYTKTGATGAYPTDPITCIAIHDSKADKYIVLLSGELEDADLQRFLKMCKDPKDEYLFPEYANVEWDVRVSVCPNEMQLYLELHRLMDRIQPQVIRGWNFCSSGKHNDGFDWPYLTNRAVNMGYPFPDERRFQVWDSMEAYARVHTRAEGQPKDGKSLNAVAFNEGIGRKVDHDGIVEMYENDKPKLMFYNVMDVFLTKTIDETSFGGITKFYLDLAREAGVSLQDTVSEMRLIDGYVTHWLAENRPRVKQPTNASTVDRFVQGSVVFKPAEKGIHGPAAEIDLSQAYTAAIRSCNFSPETKVIGTPEPGRSYITMPSGRHYYTDVKGIFPSILDGLSDKMHRLKAEGKKQQRQATKSINHSFYGNTKNKYYRNRDVDIAEDILEIVRTQSEYNKEFIEKSGFEVLYGDTDSCYHTGSSDMDELETQSKDLAAAINASYDEWVKQWGITDHYFAVDAEDVYESIVFTMKKSGKGEAKKRYAALKRDGSLKVRGFDFRRSDRSPFARRIQHEVLTSLLVTKDPNAVRRLIRDAQSGLQTGKYPITELAIPKGLGNPLDDYMDDEGLPIKGCPQHYRASIYSNRTLGTNFDWGDKVYIYHGHIDGKPRTDVFALPWGEAPPPEARVNIEQHLELVFRSPLEPILDAIGLTWQDAITNTMTTRLEDWA